MVFSGMPLAQVLAILGAASLVAVALYLLKLRRRRVAVPFLPLWESLLAERQATRLWSRLKRFLSLLVALAVIALLSFALGDPRNRDVAADARHVVLLIDAGATMQATDVAPSRLAVALDEARDVIARAGPSLNVLVAQLDADVTPLSPMSAERSVLERALEAVRPVDARTEPLRGLRFARDVLGGREDAEILLISDGATLDPATLDEALEGSPAGFSFVPVGESDDNLAITKLAVRRYPLDKSRSELLLEVDNPTNRERRLQVALIGDDQPIDRIELAVPAGQRVRRFYDDISGVDQTLEARLSFADGSGDDLPIDDRAYAVVPARKRARVLLVSDGNRYVEAALLLDEFLEVDAVTPADYRGAGDHDVVIFDGHAPAEPPGAPALYLNPPAEGGPLPGDETMERPSFTRLARQHPVLRWTALRDVNVAGARVVRPEPDDQVVAADPRGPLIVAGARVGAPFVAFTFDVRDSDLPLRVAWPLLVLNCIEWFVGEDASYVPTHTVGRPVVSQVRPGVARATLRGPGGTRELPAQGGSVVFVPSRAGIYRLDAGGESQTFAVNLDPTLGRTITPARGMRRAGAPLPAPSLPEAPWRHAPWVVLATGALLLLTLEWITYHRRWTV